MMRDKKEMTSRETALSNFEILNGENGNARAILASGDSSHSSAIAYFRGLQSASQNIGCSKIALPGL
jgi:hypothetical protein